MHKVIPKGSVDERLKEIMAKIQAQEDVIKHKFEKLVQMKDSVA